MSPECAKIVAPPSYYLVGISLVPDIPYNAVPGRIQSPLDSYRQFHRAQARRKVAPGHACGRDDEFPYLAGQGYQFAMIKVLEVGRRVYPFKNPVSYTHLRAHETRHDLVCRLLLEKKKKKK